MQYKKRWTWLQATAEATMCVCMEWAHYLEHEDPAGWQHTGRVAQRSPFLSIASLGPSKEPSDCRELTRYVARCPAAHCSPLIETSKDIHKLRYTGIRRNWKPCGQWCMHHRQIRSHDWSRDECRDDWWPTGREAYDFGASTNLWGTIPAHSSPKLK